jgi:hypothetical protein
MDDPSYGDTYKNGLSFSILRYGDALQYRNGMPSRIFVAFGCIGRFFYVVKWNNLDLDGAEALHCSGHADKIKGIKGGAYGNYLKDWRRN